MLYTRKLFVNGAPCKEGGPVWEQDFIYTKGGFMFTFQLNSGDKVIMVKVINEQILTVSHLVTQRVPAQTLICFDGFEEF
jgi:hypothetical protein